ncbi:MAG: EamA family transporter, partial [Casimicrobiaceae bacterium]
MNSTSLKTWQTWTLLALANLFWAGNWVVGRALRDIYPPVELNFWRWLLAAVILAPFALPLLRGQGALVRKHFGLLLLLAGTGAALFQTLVYVGLSGTTSVNAVLLSSSAPLFVMLCSWVIARERASVGQLAGMAISLIGIALILVRGDLRLLLRLDVHPGDVWILLAMPVFGLYSVLLRQVPPALQGTRFLFLFAALAVPLLLGPMMMQPRAAAAATMPAALAGLGYVALFASVLAFACWNRA